jgi:dCMP deaminase
MVSDKELKWLQCAEFLASQLSTCSKRQYCAVILMPNGRVVSIGYNGSPPNMPHCVDGFCPRLAENSPNGSNYDNCIAQHAEANALMWSDVSLRMGATLIVNGPPCFTCAKSIASSGVAKVVCFADSSYAQWPQVEQFLLQAKVQVDIVER